MRAVFRLIVSLNISEFPCKLSLMLRQRAGSIKEIAYAVGFRSTTHFSKIFQETYGTQPTAYAEQQALRSNPS